MPQLLTVFLFSLVLGPINMLANAEVLVQGHRGARARLPENTLPAFKYALDVGVHVLEMDLAVTSDHHLVLSHEPVIDPKICQYQDGTQITSELLINKMTLEAVKKIDCGSLKNSRFPNQVPVPGTPIPALDEVFDLVKNHPSKAAQTVLFNIETKIFLQKPHLTVDPQTFARLFVEKVQQHGLMNRVIMQSFDYRTLVEGRKLAPQLKISALSEDPQEDLIRTAQVLKADYISPYYLFVNKTLVERLHNLGVKISPWTANDEKAWQNLIDSGVDEIITDDPEGLLQFLSNQPKN